MKRLFTLALCTLLLGMYAPGTAAKTKPSPIEHIEPLNWWVGMKNPQLQLLVYGKEMAALEPRIQYPGVTLERVERTGNPNYLFLYLHIAPETAAGTVKIEFLKQDKVQFVQDYSLLAREEGSAAREGFSSADVMYLLMPDRFANGNPANDAVKSEAEGVSRQTPGGRHGGDIEGIINHLDYMQELGVTALWSTPLMLDKMPTYSYHQYAISDFYKIDPRFGSNEDYRRLGTECKKHGIKLVMDMVVNHSATTHWWYNDLPSADWIHQPRTQCNFKATTVADTHASLIDRRLNSDGWFDGSMADMNQQNPLELDYYTQLTIWWIEYAGLQGLRIDTYLYCDRTAMGQYCSRIMQEYPRFNIVGECWMHQPAECAYWQKDAPTPDGTNSQLPSVMDFPLADALWAFSAENEGWDTGLMRLYSLFAHDYLYGNIHNILLFADNHDTDRIWSTLKGDFNRFKMVMTVLATTRGIPQLYYGDEIGMDGVKSVNDGYVRCDFPGGWPGDTRNAFTRAGRTERENEIFDFMSTLLNWRKANPVIHSGRLTHFAPDNGCYVYFRTNESKKVMVVLNNVNESRTLDMTRFAEMFGGETTGRDVTTGKVFAGVDKSLTIGAKSALILELK